MSPRSHDPVVMAAALDRWRDVPIEAWEKGFLALGPITPRELAARAATVFEAGLTTPLMVIRDEAVRNNVAVLAEWAIDRGALLAPHAKATMVPQIVARQLAAGAWATTVATLGQLAALYSFGVRRFLIANQVTDPAALRWLARARVRDSSLDVACYVDSAVGARLLADSMDGGERPMAVLVELGFPGGRTGVRGVDAVDELARYARSLGLQVSGVACFEGGLGHDRSAGVVDAVRAFSRDLRTSARALTAHGADAPSDDDGFARGGIVSAGGSVYFDLVAEELADLAPDLRLVIRSGGYVVQDRGYLGLHSPLAGHGLEPAFETWAPVLSRPEPELALLGAGKRDLPFDLGLPDVLGTVDDASYQDLPGARLVQLDDQHAYLTLPGAVELEPGQVVRLGGTHPCTAFDKWRAIPVLDGHDLVVDVARTFF